MNDVRGNCGIEKIPRIIKAYVTLITYIGISCCHSYSLIFSMLKILKNRKEIHN